MRVREPAATPMATIDPIQPLVNGSFPVIGSSLSLVTEYRGRCLRDGASQHNLGGQSTLQAVQGRRNGHCDSAKLAE